MSSLSHATKLDEADNALWLLEAAAKGLSLSVRNPSVKLPSQPREQWRVVANLAGVSTATLAANIAPQFDMKAVVPGQPDKGLVRLVPESVATRHALVPVSLDDNTLVVAVSTPFCAAAIRDVAFTAGRGVEARLAPPEAVESARLVLYSDAVNTSSNGSVNVLDLDAESSAVLGESSDYELVRFCRALMKRAIESQASDIHVHAFAGGGVVRLRIDGQLQRVTTISNLVLRSLSRLMKVQGGMDPSNTLIPQDGRATVRFHGKTYDLRISTLPSSGAEALVMRILDQSRAFSLDKTNFAPWALTTLRRLGSSPTGLLLITGPTGSGKTSTLYALLGELNQPTRRIITVEDPVEYKLPGITQVQVNAKAGLTFPKALRSILRQDPDVLLVGEIRDAETAEIAVQTALTGHLVLATLHTQDAIRAITRMAELGVSPLLLADTVLGVISQRLLRQLCDHCALPVAEPLNDTERAFKELTGAAPGRRAHGCEKCNFTGFRGRFPIVEVVEINSEMRSALDAGHANAGALQSHLPASWESIEQRAAAWIEAGMTTIEEAVDSLGLRFWSRLAQVVGREVPSLVGALAEKGASNLLTSALVISADPTRRERLLETLLEAGVGAIAAPDPDSALGLIRSNRQLQHLIVDATQQLNADAILSPELRKVVNWSGLAVVLLHDAAVHINAAQSARSKIHATVVFPPSAEDLRHALAGVSAHIEVSAKDAT